MDFYDIYGFESFDKTCIEDYISIPKDKRHKNTAFYDKLFDQNLNLNIKIFYVYKGKRSDDYNFILQDFNKKKLVNLLKNAMISNKIKVNKKIENMRKEMEKDILILMNV